MRAFSKNDHLHFGFTEEFSDTPNHSIFHIGLGDLTSEPKSFFEECQRSATDLYNRVKDKKIHICLSGGIDSECVLRSFVSCHIPVEAIILKFTNDMNWHDVKPAIELCRGLNVPYTTVDLNVFEFYEQKIHLEYARHFRLSSPLIATHLWLAEHVMTKRNGIPVFAGDFARITRPHRKVIEQAEDPIETLASYFVSSKKWNFASLANQDHFALELLFRKFEQPGISNFYLYSPEQIAASIQVGFSLPFLHVEQKLLMQSLESKTPLTFYQGQISTNQMKEAVFELGGFTINKHESKWTGFELIHESMIAGSSVSGLDLRPNNNPEKKLEGMTLFNSLYRKPMEEIAQQIYLKRILLKESLYRFIESSLLQSTKKS